MPNHTDPGLWRFPVSEPSVPQPERQEELTETLAKTFELLEEYGPSWYPETLRKKVQTVLRRRISKQSLAHSAIRRIR
jgi:hypothetical protein